MSYRPWAETPTYGQQEAGAHIHIAREKWNLTRPWMSQEAELSLADPPGEGSMTNLDSSFVKPWAEDSVKLCLDFWPTGN